LRNNYASFFHGKKVTCIGVKRCIVSDSSIFYCNKCQRFKRAQFG